MSREALVERLERDDEFVLVEALPASHFANGHIPGAVSLPVDEIRRKAPVLIPNRETEIVLYCASRMCDGADKAERLLRALGYENLFHYVGGKADWKDAGLPLESGPPA